MTPRTDQIRNLNDRLRQDFSEGRAVITTGVAALGAETFTNRQDDRRL